MVNSGNVQSDLSSLNHAFNNFSSIVGELGNAWKGNSSSNFATKSTGFSSDFSSALTGQMNSFSSACDLYNQYKTTKENYKIAQDNYNAAKAAGQSTSSFSSQMSSYKSEMDSLKGQIENLLSSVKSVKLEASPLNPNVSASGHVSQNSGTSKGVQGAIDWALATAEDDSVGYSQSTRWGNPNYDCSSFVIESYEQAGIPVKTNGATYTGNMRQVFMDTGFECYDYGTVELQPGDVLLRSDHTEMYIGDGKNVGAHSNRDGRDGDSSGREVSVDKNYGNWQYVLRYTGDK